MKKTIRTAFIAAIYLLCCINGIIAQQNPDSVKAVTFNQVISTDLFNKSGLMDPLQILTGRATGVWSLKKGSNPAVPGSLMIRGISSEFSPGILYIIDGVYGADPGMLMADDIEKFEILKDAASTAIYGSRGSAGVILIETRKYKGDKKLSVHFNSFLAVNTPSEKLNILTHNEYRAFIDNNDIINFTDGGGNTDWQDEIFRTTVTQNYNFAVSGGINNTGYQISVFHQNNPGIVRGSAAKNSGFHIFISQSALRDKLKLSASAMSSSSRIENIPDYSNYYPSNNIFYQALTRNPTDRVYEEDGKTYSQSNRRFNYNNPLAVIDYTSNANKQAHLNLNFSANYKITDRLNLDVNLGSFLMNNNSDYLQLPQAVLFNSDSIANKNSNEKRHFNLDSWLNYTKIFKDSHYLIIRLGYNYLLNKENESNFPLTGTNDSIVTEQNKHYNSIAALVEYNFRQRYFFSGVINNEYSWYTMTGTHVYQQKAIRHNSVFPAFTVGWKINNESWFKLPIISSLILKGGLGYTGNAYADYLKFNRYISETEKIDMELTKELTVGMDFGLWNNRLNGSVIYYRRNTKSAVTAVPQDVPPNLVPYIYTNDIWYRKKGYEINLYARPITKERFTWFTAFNYCTTSAEIVSGKYLPRNLGAFDFGNLSWIYYTQQLQKGNGLVFYLPVTEGYINGLPAYQSENGLTDDLGAAKRKVIGQPFPKFELGWTNQFQFLDGFDLQFSLRYEGGYKIYNATRMWLSNRNGLPDLNVVQDGIDNYINGYLNPVLSNMYLENASFLRIENFSLGYTIKLKNNATDYHINIYVGGNNLLTFTSYTGYDPSGYDDGVDFFDVYPLARSFVFGIRLKL